jgi:hypothetical protein
MKRKESKRQSHKKRDSETESDSDYSSSEDSIQKINFLPAKLRLKEAIKNMQNDRKKGTKKEKENFDE